MMASKGTKALRLIYKFTTKEEYKPMHVQTLQSLQTAKNPDEEFRLAVTNRFRYHQHYNNYRFTKYKKQLTCDPAQTLVSERSWP